MPSGIEPIIQLGHDITSHKYHALATGTILFYDYLLTLADEVKYGWFGRKSWMFWLFIFNRYFPMTYQLRQLGGDYPLHFDTTLCEKTAWYSLAAFVVCTLLAQTVLTLRIYAVTMKNLSIAIGFAVIAASQLVLGIWMTVLARDGGPTTPSIPLDAYHLCLFSRHRPMEIAYTSISLFYDLLAFSLFIYLAKRSKVPGLKVRMILDIVAEDATWYFLVIFTAHLVLVLTLNLGRPTIQLLPGPGLVVYLPVMISRIMLSLRKAADSQQNIWSLVEPTASGNNIQFPPEIDNTTREDGAPLEMLPWSQTVTR